MHKTVLITGIGGNVGQGILRNIQSTGYNIKLIGTDTSAITAGNHLVDEVYEVPIGNDPNYIKSIIDICKNESVDLIIPSTDFETFYLARAADELPPIACNNPYTAKVFLDKFKTWEILSKNSIPFAESCLPSKYKNEFEEFIVKPREGRGSRDIHINPKQTISYSDDYVIQKLYKGIEITTSFYVNQIGKFHGQITFIRSLLNGMTHQCEVSTEFNTSIEKIIYKIFNVLEIRGSCNIQSIVTDDGIVPFEINGRISGTNSIRSQFGFNDVKYTLQEYLYNVKPDKPEIKKGSAVRIMMDVIYPDKKLTDKLTRKSKHIIY